MHRHVDRVEDDPHLLCPDLLCFANPTTPSRHTRRRKSVRLGVYSGRVEAQPPWHGGAETEEEKR
jgi:hypothetical protein